MRKRKFIAFFYAVAMMILSSCSAEILNMPEQEPISYDSSRHITVEQAKKRLMVIMKEINSQIPMGVNRISQTMSGAEMEVVALDANFNPMTRSDSDEASNYLIRLNDDMFAIMSATNDRPELLAIGNGYPDFNNPAATMPNPDNWILPSGEQSSIDSSLTTPKFVYKRVSTTYTVHQNGGLCNVKWGNGSPYNEYLPMVTDPWGNYTHAATGCVAVAMAQMMTVPSLHGAKYNGYTYNWKDLSQRRDALSFENEEEKHEIATLFLDLTNKNNLASNYGSPTTWTRVDERNTYVSRTFDNFGMHGGSFKYYDNDSVFNIVKSELDAGYPVYFDGSADYIDPNGIKKYGGHAWICHGMLEAKTLIEVYVYMSTNPSENGAEEPILYDRYWETSMYLQMNWGWDGKADGYYLTKYDNNLNTLEGPDIPEEGISVLPGWNNFNPRSLWIYYDVRKW